MKDAIIFFDLDGTLINLTEKLITDIKGIFIPPTKYSIEEWDFLDSREKDIAVSLIKDTNYMSTLKIFPDATEVLDSLTSAGYILYGLTARYENNETILYCRKHLPQLSDVLFTNGKSKSAIINTFSNVYGFVDDCMLNVVDVYNNTDVKYIFAILRDKQPYTLLDVNVFEHLKGRENIVKLSLDYSNRVFMHELSDLSFLLGGWDLKTNKYWKIGL